MEQMTNNVQTDVIDLRELFEILRNRKKLIFILTTIITIVTILYAMMLKPIPTYKGSTLVELGQIINEEYSDGKYSSLKINDLDNVYTLKELISTTQAIEVSVPNRTNLLSLSVTSTNKEIIEPKLTQSVTFILDRHNKIAKLYSGKNYRIYMTHVVNDIKIVDVTKKPKKKLMIIIAFITGLMLSIFLAFFLEFIKTFKRPILNEDK